MPAEILSKCVTDDEREWLAENSPDLVLIEEFPLVLIGILKFDRIYEGERIQDSYEIKIEFETSEFSSLPQVYELGGRIDKVGRDRKLKLTDMHFNPNGAACLCLKLEEVKHLPNGFSLRDYCQNLVIPFFYEQSYFERHNRWPWGEYSHGDLGYLEGYGEGSEPATTESVFEFIALLKKYSGWAGYEELLREKGKLKVHRYYCCCGSGRKARKCHLKAFKGLQKLHEDIKTLSIEI